ncbi:MAG: outer membrane protein assembly factor BamD [Desulfuromonadales bacterium]|nr:outer membrane protein assembly factor BamD [Desulfuromonadales bacterium]
MHRLLFPAAIVTLTLILPACTPQTVVPPAKQASVYFQEGESFFEQGLYPDAIASWEKVRDSYYSPELNILAEMKIAEAHFLSEQYIEAAAAYEAFLKSHPEHAKVPDVLFQLGLCYINLMADKDQDQSSTRQALAAFEMLQQRFPQDRRKEEVQIYIDRCLNQLAANEVVIGEYYLKAKQYQAAINRLEGVFTKYPNYYDRAEAYYLLGQAYMLAGDKVKASEAFNALFNQFPHSEYILAAQKFIDKNY